MVEKSIITRMDITGTEDNTLKNEKYQSRRAAQRRTSKLEGKRRKQKLRKMMNAEGRERDEANSQRSFLCCLFLRLRTRTKEPLDITPGLPDFWWPKKVTRVSFGGHVLIAMQGHTEVALGIKMNNWEPREVYSGALWFLQEDVIGLFD